MKTPPIQTAIESAPDPRDSITPAALKARLIIGEIIAATDYDESIRAQFWAAIAAVRDALPCVRPIWRTINEEHINGVRVRQKMFRICPRQKGSIDTTLAGLLALAATCAALLAGGLPV